MGAYASDFVEKVWPLVYRGSPSKKFVRYPAEGNSAASATHPTATSGTAARRPTSPIAVTVIHPVQKDPNELPKARVKALEGHFDEKSHGFDMDFPDQKRVDRFLEELARFEKEGDMPQFTVMRLPSDHTQATMPGK